MTAVDRAVLVALAALAAAAVGWLAMSTWTSTAEDLTRQMCTARPEVCSPVTPPPAPVLAP